MEDAEDVEEDLDPSDTLGVEEGEPLNPDTTRTLPPSVPPPVSPQAASADTVTPAPAPADTSSAAPLDTLQPTPGYVPLPPDSAAAARPAVSDSAPSETLFVAKPKPQPQPGSQTPAPVKKPRSGILGIHPVAILLGLAVLHYFVTKSAGG